MKNIYLPKPCPILEITLETSVEKTFKFKVDRPPSFGQFYEVSLPLVGEAPISVSDFGLDWIELTIRRVGSLTEEIHKLNIGDNVFLRGPYGNTFPVDSFKGKHLVAVAGGCGLSPIRSVINYFYQHLDSLAHFEVLMGFKTPTDIMFKRDIEKWEKKFRSIITVDQGCDIWQGKNVGLVTDYVKHIDFSHKENMVVVIVGPPIMIKFTAERFVSMGIPKKDIIVSLERRMSCGLGKCGHCKIDSTYICCDGPVFTYDQAEKMID